MHRHRKVTVYEKHMNIRCDKVVYTTIHFVNCMHWVNILNFKSSLSCFGKTFWTETRNWIESNGLQLDVRWNDWTISYLELKFISALDCGGNWTVSSKSNSAKGPINVWKYKTRKKRVVIILGKFLWAGFCNWLNIQSSFVTRSSIMNDNNLAFTSDLSLSALLTLASSRWSSSHPSDFISEHPSLRKWQPSSRKMTFSYLKMTMMTSSLNSLSFEINAISFHSLLIHN